MCVYEKGVDSFALGKLGKRLYQEHVHTGLAKWRQSDVAKESLRECS